MNFLCGRECPPVAKGRCRIVCLSVDAVLDRADVDAKVAGDALGVDHLEAAVAVRALHRDRLVRGVLAGRIAAPALDAGLLVDPGSAVRDAARAPGLRGEARRSVFPRNLIEGFCVLGVSNAKATLPR